MGCAITLDCWKWRAIAGKLADHDVPLDPYLEAMAEGVARAVYAEVAGRLGRRTIRFTREAARAVRAAECVIESASR